MQSRLPLTFRGKRDNLPFEFVNMRVHNAKFGCSWSFSTKILLDIVFAKKAKRGSRVKISHGRATVNTVNSQQSTVNSF